LGQTHYSLSALVVLIFTDALQDRSYNHTHSADEETGRKRLRGFFKDTVSNQWEQVPPDCPPSLQTRIHDPYWSPGDTEVSDPPPGGQSIISVSPELKW
jgi:hypothetical protein